MKTHLIYNLYFRAPCTARPLGTSSISFSENKESSTSLSEDQEKRPEENEAKAEVMLMGRRAPKWMSALNFNATSTSQLEPVVKPEDSKQVEKTRSGKESLLGATWGNEGGGHNRTQNKTPKDSTNEWEARPRAHGKRTQHVSARHSSRFTTAVSYTCVQA